MMIVAVSTGGAILAVIGLVLGLVVLIAVIGLFNRIMTPASEIDAYASDILTAGLGIAGNLDAVDELETTRSLGGAVPGLAVGYLRKLGLVE
jgi:hypothetical protein